MRKYLFLALALFFSINIYAQEFFYRTTSGGDWATTATWQRRSGDLNSNAVFTNSGPWGASAPPAVNISGSYIRIRHNVSTADVSVSTSSGRLYIENGSTLTVNNFLNESYEKVRLVGGGILDVSNDFSVSSGSGTIVNINVKTGDFIGSGGNNTVNFSEDFNVTNNFTISGGNNYIFKKNINVGGNVSRSNARNFIITGDFSIGGDFASLNGRNTIVDGNVVLGGDFTLTGGGAGSGHSFGSISTTGGDVTLNKESVIVGDITSLIGSIIINDGVSIGGSLIANTGVDLNANVTVAEHLTVSMGGFSSLGGGSSVSIGGNTSVSGGVNIPNNGSVIFSGTANMASLTLDGGSSISLNGSSASLGNINIGNGVIDGTSPSVSYTGSIGFGSGAVCSYTDPTDVLDLENPFDLGDCANALPIELVYFKAEQTLNGFKLDWLTAQELNNDYFVVEYSTNFKSYQEVHIEEGADTSSSSVFYSLEIQGIELDDAEIVYFRLKQVDYDGKYSYSNVIAVTLGDVREEGVIDIYPNPSHGLVILDLNNNLGKKMRIVNVSSGEVVFETIALENKLSLDLTLFSKGVYMVYLEGSILPNRLLIN